MMTKLGIDKLKNLLVSVKDPVSRIFMKTNKISLLRNITFEDLIALSKWLQKSGKCNLSFLQDWIDNTILEHYIQQYWISTCSCSSFLSKCRRNTLVVTPALVILAMWCMSPLAAPGLLTSPDAELIRAELPRSPPGLYTRPRPAHPQPKPLVQSLSLDLSTLNVNRILKFIKHFKKETFSWFNIK